MSRGAARSGTRRRRRAQRKHHSPAAPHRAPRHAASQQRRAEPQSHLPRYQPPQITGPQERVRVREHPPHRRPVHPGQPPPPEDHGDEQSADGAPRPEPLRLAGDVLSRGRGCISGVRICRWGVARRRGGAGWVRVAPHQRVSLLVELLVHAPQHGHPAPTLAYLVPEVLGELLGSLPQRRGLRGGVVAVAKDDGPYDAALVIGYGVDNKFPSTPALESRTLLGAQLFCAKSAKNLILTGAPVDYSWENVSPAETMRHFAEKLIANYTKTEYVHDSYPKCPLPGFGYVYPGPPRGASKDGRGEHRRIRELTGNSGGCEHRARRHTCVGKKFTWVLEEASMNTRESAIFSFEEAKKRGWSKIVIVASDDQLRTAKVYASVAEEMAATDPEAAMTIRVARTPD
mmetsp:Transcript_10612/g.43990  ORF Transcript_10612/g.43990 Transcript_10612/m.43990 type:complete len:401 (+) Transcript_10612:2109-3311(+)